MRAHGGAQVPWRGGRGERAALVVRARSQLAHVAVEAVDLSRGVKPGGAPPYLVH